MSPNQDQGGGQAQSFKEQLDKEALARRFDERYEKQSQNPILEKITQYVPAAAKVLGGADSQPDEAASKQGNVPGPPHRPDHDHKIEDFVRDQHRSKGADVPTDTQSQST